MQSIDIFPWDDNFNTGLPNIDEQHKKLVQLLNLLASHVAFRSDIPQLNQIFDELADYTVYHFQTEEAIWGEFFHGDEAEAEHKLTHQKFVETVLRLKREQATKPIDTVAEEALGFLARWLASHILETDRRMAYTVLAIKEGLSLDEAKVRSNVQMSGATRVLIDIIISIYDTLSTNTLHLMRELAQRKQREIELVGAQTRAEAANIAKSRFLGNMSHELKTPLNGIMGMAQLLMDSEVAPTDRQEFAQTIYNSGKLLLQLLNDVLSLSSIEVGTLALDLTSCDLRKITQEVYEQFVQAANKKGLQLNLRIDETLAQRYQCDSIRLQQMLSHLLDNAIKFTSSGAISIDVSEVEKRSEGSMLELSVTDTGIGIPLNKQHELFQPFTQADDANTRQFAGAGIGLSVVRGLALLMDGDVGVQSVPGEGSRVWFRIYAGRDIWH